MVMMRGASELFAVPPQPGALRTRHETDGRQSDKTVTTENLNSANYFGKASYFDIEHTYHFNP